MEKNENDNRPHSGRRYILRPLPGGNSLPIKALDGTRLIYQTDDLFKNYIDPAFFKPPLNKAGIPTLETLVQAGEALAEKKLLEIFSSLPARWEDKWLSQNQIIEFCEKFPEWLRPPDNVTMFLCKKDEHYPVDEDKPQDNLFVATVYRYLYSYGLAISLHDLNGLGLWNGNYVVAPQRAWLHN